MEVKELGDRPINIITKRLEEIQNEKEALSNFSNKKYEIEEERQKLGIEIKEQENELEFLKELRILHEKQDLEKQKVIVNENMIKEYKNKIEILQEDINNKAKNENGKIIVCRESELSEKRDDGLIENEYNQSDRVNNISRNEKSEKIESSQNLKRKNKKVLAIALNIVFFLIVILSVVSKNYYITLVTSVVLVLTLVYSYTQYRNKYVKINNKIQENVENVDENLNQYIEKNLEKKKEIEVLEKAIEKLEEEIAKTNQKLEQEFKFEKEKLRNKYIGRVLIKIIDEKLEKQTVVYDINVLQNKISENKVKLHSIDLDKNNVMPKLENLANLEEEYGDLEEQYEELCKKNELIELVKEEIGKAYETMKKSITPKFTNNLSKIIEKISEGKYKNIQLDEAKGMIVEIENGNYVSVKNLSVGTIDELYLSLRIGAGLEISSEKLPIILDETFAYWDDVRLQNILVYLNEEFKTRQIILFTCTNREERILDKLGVDYNRIEL